MASIKRSSSSPSTDKVSEARQRLLSQLRAMVGTLNAEIFRLETTGTVQGSKIDKAYEPLAWAVDALWEEQEVAL